MPKYVYRFSEGDKDQKDLLGGKGANLAEMTRLDLPVPPGFTITTDACRAYLASGEVPEELSVQVTTALRGVEEELGRELGAAEDPLLVSVRSGAKFSMPGMMETVLNIGLNDVSVKGLAAASSDERFAWDSYRRLIQMFGKTVLDIDGEHFSAALDAKKAERGVKLDYELDVDALTELVAPRTEGPATGAGVLDGVDSTDGSPTDEAPAEVRVIGSDGALVASTSGRTVVLLGVPGVVVVDTPDALLVTTPEHAQDVKGVVDALKESGREDLL